MKVAIIAIFVSKILQDFTAKIQIIFYQKLIFSNDIF